MPHLISLFEIDSNPAACGYATMDWIRHCPPSPSPVFALVFDVNWAWALAAARPLKAEILAPPLVYDEAAHFVLVGNRADVTTRPREVTREEAERVAA
jgi:hypothetical protein